MAIEFGETYNVWRNKDFFSSSNDQSQDIVASQILDHGSVSFGRYAVESLSWEKRSVFGVNRRQEELEKFSSYGLVSKKKAYFEEYYKKIRAMKASQADHQTDINLGCGEDVIISNQFDDVEDETKNVCSARIQENDTEVYIEKVLRCKAPVEALQQDLQLSSSTMKSFEEVKQDCRSSYIIEVHNSNVEPTIDEGAILIADDVNSESNCETENASQPISLFVKPRNSKLEELSNATRKTASKITIRKENNSVMKLKDTVTSTRDPLKPENENKILSSGSGTQKIEKVKDNTNKSNKNNKAAFNLSGNHMSASVIVRKTLQEERRSNITIPQPFSFATEKRAAANSRIKVSRPAKPSVSTIGSMSSEILAEHTQDVQTIKSRSHNLSLNSKKLNNAISFDGKKPRKEKPTWR